MKIQYHQIIKTSPVNIIRWKVRSDNCNLHAHQTLKLRGGPSYSANPAPLSYFELTPHLDRVGISPRHPMSILYLGPISGKVQRRLGLTARTPWGGNLLIMHQSQHQRGPTPDAFSHNPVSSSDEALSEVSDGVSDVSVPPSKDLKASAVALTATAERGHRSLRSWPGPEFDVDKSNISSTRFVSAGSNSVSPSGQLHKRSYQTMNGEAMDDDVRTSLWASKKPKTKKFYGQSNSKRDSSAASREDMVKMTKEIFPAGGRKLHAQGHENLVSSPCKPGVVIMDGPS
jgi:hypothetical protein